MIDEAVITGTTRNDRGKASELALAADAKEALAWAFARDRQQAVGEFEPIHLLLGVALANDPGTTQTLAWPWLDAAAIQTWLADHPR